MTHEQEIQQLIHALGEAFSALDIDAWLNGFHLPHTIATPDSVFSSHSHDDTRAAMLPLFEKMRQRGFSKTELETCNIKLLSDTTAMVSTIWSRFAADELLERIGATYFVMCGEQGWKAVMVTTHGPEVLAIS